MAAAISTPDHKDKVFFQEIFDLRLFLMTGLLVVIVGGDQATDTQHDREYEW